MDRRTFLMTGACGTLVSSLIPAGASAQGTTGTAPVINVLKSPTCGCCTAWVAHLRNTGFAVEAEDVDQDTLWAAKDRLQIAPEFAGCHTAIVGDYFLEGHVPAADITRLLAERPAALGLTVPGMPMSAPGMGGPGAGDSFETLLVAANGQTSVFARHL